jgi:hypothetical protein
MGDRIRQLEEALATLHSQHSDDPHPLLSEDATAGAIEASQDEQMPPVDDKQFQQQSKETLDAFGTLSISDHGISRFFGPTGGSEVRCILTVLQEYNPPDTRIFFS